MQVASLELCKELYELSAWEIPDDQTHWSHTVAASAPEHFELWPKKYAHADIPAYDLGYLLRKLAVATIIQKNGEEYTAVYDTYMYRAATPEDATCKLAIELFKSGVLTKEAKP